VTRRIIWAYLGLKTKEPLGKDGRDLGQVVEVANRPRHQPCAPLSAAALARDASRSRTAS